MSSVKCCPHCGEAGPVALHVVGDHRIGVCANQHQMTRERLGAQPFAHQRLSDWLTRLERGSRAATVPY